jgi:hypothetical protein
MSQNVLHSLEIVVQIFKSVLHLFFALAPDRPHFFFGHLDTFELGLLELFKRVFVF